jgi:hypothetical protein
MIFGVRINKHYYQASASNENDAAIALLTQAQISGDSHRIVKDSKGEKLVPNTLGDILPFVKRVA